MIDKYLNINFIFDVGINNEQCGTVVKRYHGLDGIAIIHLHTNPSFDTREYEIEFTYRKQDKYYANLITENIYVQVDDKGNHFQLLAEIQDYWKDGTKISKEEGKIISANGI